MRGCNRGGPNNVAIRCVAVRSLAHGKVTWTKAIQELLLHTVCVDEKMFYHLKIRSAVTTMIGIRNRKEERILKNACIVVLVIDRRAS